MLENKVEMANYIGKRKHVSQMTNDETNGLIDRLKSVEENGLKWKMTGHALKRISEKGINATFQDMVSTIYDSTVVEYKIDANVITGEPEERVMISSNTVVNKCFKLKVVYSLTENRIITAWVNHVKDKHKTLDWSLYSDDMPVYNL